MQLTYRGSVNSWECDENDHLNVRFYVEKHWQALCGWLSSAGLSESIPPEELLARVQVQHLRFLKESRLAAPLSGYAGAVVVSDGRLQVLTELRHSCTGEVMCTCIHYLRDVAAAVTESLPDHGAPRGIDVVDIAHAALRLQQLEDYGFQAIGMGLIQTTECEHGGAMQIQHYMGRISDSMPHLWGALYAGDGLQFQHDGDDEGGAVVEYRLRYHQPLRRHDRFAVMSGIAAVGVKVQRFAHLLCNADTGEVCVSAQAAAVRMDLHARRALALSAEQQARLAERLLKPMV